MPRALWNGSLSFGLVNIPVALVPATRDRSIRLREVNVKTVTPVRVRKVCTEDGAEVPEQEIGRGIDLDGTRVVLTEQELASAQPNRTDTIEIASFADATKIDPVLYDKPYWVVPSGSGQGTLRAYKLLVQALRSADRAAIGETVIHNREHPVVIRSHEERLLLSTLLFSHEVRDVSELEIPQAHPDPDAVKRAVAIVEELSSEFEPARYHDRHRERLKALIASKARGERIESAPEPAAPEPAPDLMDALEQSLAEIRARSPRRGGTKARSLPSQRRQAPRA